jgi:hypothetical protein
MLLELPRSGYILSTRIVNLRSFRADVTFLAFSAIRATRSSDVAQLPNSTNAKQAITIDMKFFLIALCFSWMQR